MPKIYIRAGDYGCVEFSPVNLTRVDIGQSRAIQPIAYNTNKCRHEPAGADVDGNGQSDDSQPLYMARQGDGFLGENPDRTYLFRNFYAAEVQMGISDYSPSGTPAGSPENQIQEWNLLASTGPSSGTIAFNKLVILEDINGNPRPIVLAKNQLNQCIAYEPGSTAIIKKATQSTRYLTNLTSMPGGLTCDS